MCRLDVHSYRHCHHRKRTHLEPCSYGFNAVTQCCNANARMVHRVHYEPFPLFCPPCYRNVEEQICDKHDKIILNLQSEAQRIREVQAQVQQDFEAKRLALRDDEQRLRATDMAHGNYMMNIERMIGCVEERIQEIREARRQELKGFRDNQGVWGDG